MTLGRKKEVPPLQESSLLLLYSLTPAQGLPVFIVLFIQVLAQSHTPEANPGLGEKSGVPGSRDPPGPAGCWLHVFHGQLQAVGFGFSLWDTPGPGNWVRSELAG